jgi:hypothetical protein
MKRMFSLTCLVLLLGGIACSKDRPAVPAKPDTTTSGIIVPRLPKEATEPLTEAEFAKLVKAGPKLSAVLRDSKYAARMNQSEDFALFLVRYIEGMQVLPGMDYALKTGGLTWQDFRRTMYKIAAASFAASVDKAVKRFEALQATSSQVPDANKRFVVEHQTELGMGMMQGVTP